MLTQGRQNPTIDEEIFETALQTLADVFNRKWLSNSSGTNPLQIVWNRRDWLASAELTNLGINLSNVRHHAPATWVADVVNKIKSGDVGNRQGALFELFVAGGLHNPPRHEVVCPPPHTPGYDLILRYPDQSQMRISLKHYGSSVHSQSVVRECKQIEAWIRENAPYSLTVLVTKSGQHPQPSEWKQLREYLTTLISQQGYGSGNIEDWSMHVMPVSVEPGMYLDQRRLSYKLLVSVPFHQNEEQNLFSKLDYAVSNLIQHSPTQSQSLINAVLVHLPVEASLQNCRDWATEYLKNHIDAPIAGVMFYQPSITSDVSGTNSHITHVYNDVFRQEYRDTWFSSDAHKPNWNFQVGTPRTEPSRLILRIGDQQIDVNDQYVFQSGHIYLFSDWQGDGLTMNVSGFQGVQTHAIGRFPNGQEIELTGIFPPKHELYLL